jgi:hypothetical protein
MSKKLWQNMTLTEKSQTYNKMRDRFPDKGASSASEAKIMQLCEMNIPADNDAIGGVIRGEVPLEKIKLATTVKPSTETKTRSTFGERSVPEAMRLAAEYNSSVADEDQKTWHYFVYC